MILRKRYRIVFAPFSKEIIFSEEFDPKSTTHLGFGRNGSSFDTKLELNSHILTNKLKLQPETTKVI